MQPICHINLARGYRGGERQTELLIRELADRGYEQRLIARAGEPLTQRLQGIPALTIIEARKPFLRHVQALRGTITHAHDARATKLAHLGWRLFAAPYVITRRLGKRPGNNFLTRRIYRDAGAVAAVAGSVAAVLREYTQRDDIAVVHSAVSRLTADPDRQADIRARWPNRFVVVNVAALVHSQKGQRHLIHVARRLDEARPEIQFVLLGDGQDREPLEAEAQGLSNICFEGFVHNPGNYLAAADMFVLPSLHEGIGGACLDAFDFGLPVVASAVDGVPEVVKDEYSGLLVPPADEDALFDAICRVHDDPELAARLGRAGRMAGKAFYPARMADQYATIYAGLA